MGGSASSLSSTFSQSLDPQPVSARYFQLAQTFEVTFNRNLTPGVLAHLNWTMKPNGFNRIANTATAAANLVTGTTAVHIAGPAIDTIKYAAAPADVTALREGTPAVAFTDFPMTILP